MCRPFGKSTSEISAASKVAGILSRNEKEKRNCFGNVLCRNTKTNAVSIFLKSQMDIFTHTISYVTVDTTIARYLALGSQLFCHSRCHRDTADQLAFCYLPVISSIS